MSVICACECATLALHNLFLCFSFNILLSYTKSQGLCVYPSMYEDWNASLLLIFRFFCFSYVIVFSEPYRGACGSTGWCDIIQFNSKNYVKREQTHYVCSVHILYIQCIYEHCIRQDKMSLLFISCWGWISPPEVISFFFQWLTLIRLVRLLQSLISALQQAADTQKLLEETSSV